MSLAQRLFGAGEPDGPTPADVAVNLPLETVYQMLSTWRRRAILRELDARDDGDGVDMRDLARAVASAECGKPADEISNQEYKRVYVALYQTHGPQLREAGLIDFERAGGTIHATAQTAEVARFLAINRTMIAEGRANE